MRKLFVFIVVAGGLLVVTNPGMDDFEGFVRTRAADRIERELGDGTLSELMGGAGGALLSSNISRITERQSFLVCSLYTLDLDRDGRSNGRALGIAGQFVVIEEFQGEDESKAGS